MRTTRAILEAQGKERAEAFRRVHHLGAQPLGDLVALVERTTGHDVAVLDAGIGEHGLTMRDPQRDVVFIGVARTRHPMRQRSTLAHELAHVLFEDWNDGEELNVRSQEEMRADAFARHLLLPGDGLKEFLGSTTDLSESDLSAVVQWFLVSPAIAAIALHDHGYIDSAVKREWMGLTTPRLATRFGWLDHYQSLQEDSDRTRSPRRLLARTIAGYCEGVVSTQTVATLWGISANEASERLAEAGIVPYEPDIPELLAEELPPVDISDLYGETVDSSAS
ncbi:MAG: ImmA/IrrE family metallo-endopeptidase [Propionibacteriaceae bacterium]|jgi:Zn-dependent peptidase ImmA (M78 family)|nr:ImmA/IrrE family metallo-endopeptidase [Propionibacteriaceae bacterium]